MGKTDAHRAIAQEDSIGIEANDLVSRVVCRHHSDFAAVRCQPTQNVVLGAKVVCDHLHHLHPVSFMHNDKLS